MLSIGSKNYMSIFTNKFMLIISVIVTTYNSHESIGRTLNSIFRQKGNNADFKLEVLVADDCSTDNTLSIIKKYPVKFFVNNKNSGGPNKGRNTGLEEATGDFICIVDHDDEWKEDKLITQLQYIHNTPIITSGQTIVNLNDNKSFDRVSISTKEFILYSKNEIFCAKLSRSAPSPNTYLGSTLYSKQLKEIYFEEHFGMIDSDWMLKLYHQNTSIEICKSLYNRYIKSNNLSLNKSYRKNDYYYSLLTLEEYEDQYPDLVKQGYLRIQASRAKYFYLIGDMKNARKYFLKSKMSFKNIAYYLSTFWGADMVKKKFNVFG